MSCLMPEEGLRGFFAVAALLEDRTCSIKLTIVAGRNNDTPNISKQDMFVGGTHEKTFSKRNYCPKPVSDGNE